MYSYATLDISTATTFHDVHALQSAHRYVSVVRDRVLAVRAVRVRSRPPPATPHITHIRRSTRFTRHTCGASQLPMRLMPAGGPMHTVNATGGSDAVRLCARRFGWGDLWVNAEKVVLLSLRRMPSLVGLVGRGRELRPGPRHA